MGTIAKSIEFTAQRTGDRKDRGGQPYILHPMRVAYRCTTPTRTKVAWMHDLVEDEGVTYDEIRALGFGEDVIDGLAGVTHILGETYPAFIIRASTNEDSKEVKIFDLDDNLDVRRLPIPITDRAMKNVVKYQLSHAFLTDKIDKEEYLVLCASNGIR